MLLACSGHQYHFLRFQLPKKVQPQTSMWCRVELVKTLANRSNDNRAMKMGEVKESRNYQPGNSASKDLVLQSPAI